MAGATPNTKLGSLLREAGLSRKALARSVRELSEARGHPGRCDHTAVTRWLAGVQPRPATAALVVDVLRARLGRTLTSADVGFRSVEQVDEHTGVNYPADLGASVAALADLWWADQSEQPAVVSAPVMTSAWFEAPLGWLVSTPSSRLPGSSAGSVGRSDVDRLRATVAAFAEMDDRFGGGHARKALVEYLRSDVTALLRGSCSEATGRRLHREAATATLLVAWMSYDAGLNGLAQRYFIQALRLAHAADDALLGGSILDAMSHQATFLGRHREAATLARAARHGTSGRGTPTLTAHFHAMEARAYAAGGDGAAAQRSLGEAVRAFDRRRPEADPDWIGYFDDAELAAEFAHCFGDLQRHDDAVRYALESVTGSVRSDFFTSMVLATGHLGAGSVDQACRVAGIALDAGRALRSARALDYVKTFRRRLGPYATVAEAVDLSQSAVGNPLWDLAEPTG